MPQAEDFLIIRPLFLLVTGYAGIGLKWYFFDLKRRKQVEILFWFFWESSDSMTITFGRLQIWCTGRSLMNSRSSLLLARFLLLNTTFFTVTVMPLGIMQSAIRLPSSTMSHPQYYLQLRWRKAWTYRKCFRWEGCEDAFSDEWDDNDLIFDNLFNFLMI